jgi:hypothetical protein
MPASAATGTAVAALAGNRLAAGAGVIAAALATAPPPRRWRGVFRELAGLAEGLEAGWATVLLTAVTVGCTAAGAWATVVVAATLRWAVWRTAWTVLTMGAVAR